MVRQAKSEDLEKSAKVHIECFPNSFSTALGNTGGYLLTRFYREYLSKVPELFLVSENEHGEIDGFCMGYYMEDNSYQKNFLRHNFFRISVRLFVLLVTGNKSAWKKIFSVFRKKKYDVIVRKNMVNDIPLTKQGDLLSICVLPSCRGSGISSQLMSEYEKALSKAGRKVCILSVEDDNARGIGFYGKNGYEVYKEIKNKGFVYAKCLKQEN